MLKTYDKRIKIALYWFPIGFVFSILSAIGREKVCLDLRYKYCSCLGGQYLFSPVAIPRLRWKQTEEKVKRESDRKCGKTREHLLDGERSGVVLKFVPPSICVSPYHRDFSGFKTNSLSTTSVRNKTYLLINTIGCLHF